MAEKTEAVADTGADAEPEVEVKEEAQEQERSESPIAEWGDWEEWQNENGISYFYNKKTEASVWEDPRTTAEREAMQKKKASKKVMIRPPAFLPREAWEAAIKAASTRKEKVDAGPTKPSNLEAVPEVFTSVPTPRKPEFHQAISTIREELETMRSRGTSRVSDGKARSRGESEWTEADSDSEASELDDDEKTQRMRALLRLDSAKDWGKENLSALHDEMHEQLEALTSQARKSGMVLPQLHKRAPRRPPPALPPPSVKIEDTDEKKNEVLVDAASADSQKSALSDSNKLGSRSSLLARPPRPFHSSPNLGLTGSRASSTRSLASVTSVGTAPGGENLKRQASLFLNNAPYVVIADWAPEPSSRTKIAILKGDAVIIQKQGSTGWWLGKNLRTNQSGYFPGSYCEKSDDPLILGSSRSVGSAPPRPARPPPKASGSIWKAKLMHQRSKAQKKQAAKKRSNIDSNYTYSSQLSEREENPYQDVTSPTNL